jgi:subtilase family serine protease
VIRVTKGKKLFFKRFLSVCAVLIMMESAFVVLDYYQNLDGHVTLKDQGIGLGNSPLNRSTLNLGQRVNLPCISKENNSSTKSTFKGKISVLVTFKIDNQPELMELLQNLSNKNNPEYHNYLSRAQFAKKFSVSKAFYNEAVQYFKDYSNVSIKTFADRLSIQISGKSQSVGRIFNTVIGKNGSGSSLIYEPKFTPSLPLAIGEAVSQISGLSNRNVAYIDPLRTLNTSLNGKTIKGTTDKLPAPLCESGTQYIFGSDLQAAYDEQSLFNATYPTNEVVATILWAGTGSNGQSVGPFFPANIYSYYNRTIPAGEPHSHVFGVPINGALPPGPSSTGDTTGANIENTLDLEMVGSTAPGSTIFNVYGPNSTLENINAAFAYILNPGSAYSKLNNVSVITNSFGTPEFNDTTWYEYLEESQARGITVLASSGDSGDSSLSSEYQSNPGHPSDYLNFPASMAFNSFGVTSVGGTTLKLSQNLHIKKQTAWYEGILYSLLDPVGSTGGISCILPETTWEKDTEANRVIQGKGLGVPDLGAIANNTLMCITSNSVQTLEAVGGTSVASPSTAGIIAEINAVLNFYNESNIGYLNPILFPLASKEFSGLSGSNGVHYDQTGNYNSSLPLSPFYNVNEGGNSAYTAVYGYNLVTGWGSINAYNLTEFVSKIGYKLNPDAYKGIRNTISSLVLYGNSTRSGKTIEGGGIFQSFYIADQLGAPIYFVQDFVNITLTNSGSFSINDTTLVTFPLTGKDSTSPIYEYKSSTPDIVPTIPSSFTLTSWISYPLNSMYPKLNFKVNVLNVSLSLPGASYIVGGYNYNFTYEGETYTNGLYSNSKFGGNLAPQFFLSGLSHSTTGDYSKGISGNITSSIESFESSNYTVASIHPFNKQMVRDEDYSVNLQYKKGSGNTWKILFNSSSTEKGILSYLESYKIKVKESGLIKSSLWYVNINGVNKYDIGNTLTLVLINGTYTLRPENIRGFVPYPQEYSFKVNGSQAYSLLVEFQSGSNKTLINQISTIGLGNGKTESGNVVNVGYLNYTGRESLPKAFAIDNSLEKIFSPDYLTGNIVVTNSSTGAFITNISLGKDVGPEWVYYNNNSKSIFVYDENSGNISVINPSSNEIVKTVHLNGFSEKYATIHYSKQTSDLYIFANFTGIYSLNVINYTEVFSPFNSLRGSSPYFAIYNRHLYTVNSQKDVLSILNLESDNIANKSLPVGFTPFSIFKSGINGTLYISGQYVNSYVLLSVNTSSRTIKNGPKINGLAISSSYDSFNGMIYVPAIGNFSYVDVFNPLNNTLVGSAPFIMGSSFYHNSAFGIFNSQTQDFYAYNDLYSYVYRYNIQHFYMASFMEHHLPKVANWDMSIVGIKSTGYLNSLSYSTYLPNGTYGFTATSSVERYILYPYEGYININGHSGSATLNFTYSYFVNISQKGLPSSISWYVNISGIQPSGKLSQSNYTALIPNGTFSYFTSTNNKIYAPVESTGTVIVKGINTNFTINFYLVTFKVSFLEKNLAKGTKWTIEEKNGSKLTTISQSLAFNLPNGTYTFEVLKLNDYYIISTEISLVVKGKNLTEKVEYFHYAYISGILSPSGAKLTINGKVIPVISGSFNISVEAGYFQLLAIDSGHDSYHSDFSLLSGNSTNFNIELKRVFEPTAEFYTLFYTGIVLAIVAMVIGSVYLAIRKK